MADAFHSRNQLMARSALPRASKRPCAQVQARACLSLPPIPRPVWLGFVLPNGLKRLVIFGDNDDSGTGQSAAEKLACRACAAGIAVTVAVPKTPNTDWAMYGLNVMRCA